MTGAGAPAVAIGGLVHESSTFMVEYLGALGQSAFACHEGTDLLAAFDGTATVTGGYLAACAGAGVEVRPVLHARAEPGPAVEPAALRALLDRLLSGLREAGECDVVLLDLHGAGVAAPDRSIDLAVVREVRALLPNAVIGATMDLHGNVPAELVDHVDVLTGFLEYPHIDAADRSLLVGRIALAAAAGTARPVTRIRRLPMLMPPSPTVAGTPGRELRDLVRRIEARPGVLACSVFHGFPFADTPQAATSVVTVTDGDSPLAQECCDEVAEWLLAQRHRFLDELISPEDAVRQALAGAPGTVVIGDATDNPGCGAAGDSTYLLRALLEVPEPTCLATLWDPDTVAAAAAAGPGARIAVRLGGAHGWASGPPVEAEAVVRTVTDGRIVQTAMRRGKQEEFGRCARLTIGATEVIVASNRRQVFDPEILLLHGIVPQRYRIVAVKSLSHFRAGFADTGRLMVADAPGPTSRRIEDIPRPGPTGELWPMNAPAERPGAPERQRI